jgi:hypothetical protein
MAENLENFLIKQIKLTGFPLQVEIASYLENKKYGVRNNEYYFDPDEKKARDIDIDAYPTQRDYRKIRIDPFSIVHRLAIECKKSETHAWIFFTQTERLKLFHGQCIDFLQVLSKDLELCFSDLISKTSHYNEFKKVASSYTEIPYQGHVHNRSDKSEIFEAKNQLTKFISYDIKDFLKRTETKLVVPFSSNYLSWIYYPIIVFDGKLFEAICQNNTIQLAESKHVLLLANYSPSYLKLFPETDSHHLPYLIDVVRRDYFPEFIDLLENEFSNRCKYVHENFDRLFSRVQEYLPDEVK